MHLEHRSLGTKSLLGRHSLLSLTYDLVKLLNAALVKKHCHGGRITLRRKVAMALNA